MHDLVLRGRRWKKENGKREGREKGEGEGPTS